MPHTFDTYAAEVLADNPMAWWPLGDGTVEDDLSPNGRDLTWSGTTPTAVDLRGFYGGVTAAGTSLSQSPDVVGKEWRTAQALEAWVQTTETGQMAIASARNAGEAWAFYHANAWGGLRFNYRRLSASVSVDFGVAVNDGLLHQVCLDWYHTAGDGHVGLFIDGVFHSSAPLLGSSSGSATYLTVGSEVGPSRRWVGGLAHVSLYDHVVGSDRWLAHYTLARRGWFAGRPIG